MRPYFHSDNNVFTIFVRGAHTLVLACATHCFLFYLLQDKKRTKRIRKERLEEFYRYRRYISNNTMREYDMVWFHFMHKHMGTYWVPIGYWQSFSLRRMLKRPHDARNRREWKTIRRTHFRNSSLIHESFSCKSNWQNPCPCWQVEEMAPIAHMSNGTGIFQCLLPIDRVYDK